MIIPKEYLNPLRLISNQKGGTDGVHIDSLDWLSSRNMIVEATRVEHSAPYYAITKAGHSVLRDPANAEKAKTIPEELQEVYSIASQSISVSKIMDFIKDPTSPDRSGEVEGSHGPKAKTCLCCGATLKTT